MTTNEENKFEEIADEIYKRGYDDGLKSAKRTMKPDRAYEIECNVFGKYENEIIRDLDCSCDSTTVKFLMGKWLGLMKRALREELLKETEQKG